MPEPESGNKTDVSMLERTVVAQRAPRRSGGKRQVGRAFLYSPSKVLAIARILLSFIVVIGLWELTVRILDISHLMLPAPTAIYDSLLGLFTAGLIWRHMGITLFEIGVGFAIGTSAGVLLGTAIAMWRSVEILVYPYAIALNSIPKIALAPLMITWFGFGLESKIVMAALISFFPVLVNTIAGLRAVESQQLELMKALDASKWQVFLRLRIPSSLPFVFAGLEVGVVVSVIGAIVGEFVGASAGLGYLIMLYNSQLQVASAFAILVILGTTGIVLHEAVVIARRRIVHWDQEEVGEPHASA